MAVTLNDVPLKETSRAQRRHDNERLKRVRARHTLAAEPNGAAPSPRRLGMHLHTAAICSCASCGNPRKYFDLPTMQEQRADQRPRMRRTNG